MYKNIDVKIKTLALLIAFIGIISSIIIGIIIIVKGVDSINENFLIFRGIIVLVAGPISSWISSWLLYGYGELIHKTSEIAENTLIMKNISYEEFNLKQRLLK